MDRTEVMAAIDRELAAATPDVREHAARKMVSAARELDALDAQGLSAAREAEWCRRRAVQIEALRGGES